LGNRRDVVVVGHSLGGFTAPLVCARTPVDLLVLVAVMIPSPGELFSDWWTNTGYEDSGHDDRMFPAEWARRHARERLGIEPDEIDGGHYIALARPRQLADRLVAYAAELQ
jgi:pimeloyl-ACP methyl ester carboxylesterase